MLDFLCLPNTLFGTLNFVAAFRIDMPFFIDSNALIMTSWSYFLRVLASSKHFYVHPILSLITPVRSLDFLEFKNSLVINTETSCNIEISLKYVQYNTWGHGGAKIAWLHVVFSTKRKFWRYFDFYYNSDAQLFTTFLVIESCLIIFALDIE